MERGRSIVFSPKQLGPMTVPNRFIRSATGELCGNPDGTPGKRLIDMIISYSKGECGLIVPGCLHVCESGRMFPQMPGMSNKLQSDSWKPVINEVHKNGSKILLQLYHPGIASNPQFNGGVMPMGPTSISPQIHAMTNQEIEEMIQSFINAGVYSYRSGADGCQLQLSNKYLLSGFLSPFYNRRTDKWGGTVDNRLRIVKEIISGIKAKTPESFALSVKMNTDDHLPNGINKEMALQHVHSMEKDVDLFELTNGAVIGKHWGIRGKVDQSVLLRGVPGDKKNELLKMAQDSFDGVPFEENYNQADTEFVRRNAPNVNIAMVGGIRSFDSMENIIKSNVADMVAMSRPFIRDPYVVKKFKEGKIDKSSCISCATCLINLGKGLYCHVKAD